jgi:hypothetical protein
MISFAKLSLVSAGLAGLAHPAFARPASGSAECHRTSVAKAIYIITNDPGQNAVLAIPVAQDGTLLDGGTLTPTGGVGSISIDGATGQPAATDALVSQSALTIAGNVSNVRITPVKERI